MTTPEPSAAAPPPLHPRAASVLLGKPLTVRRAAQIIASVTVAVTILAAVLIHFTDRKSFPNIGDSLWWAIQTVTTVGYGDLVPTSAAGRLGRRAGDAVGIGLATGDHRRDHLDSSSRPPAAHRGHHQQRDLAKLDHIAARLEEIEAGLNPDGATTTINRDQASAGEP